MTPDDKNWISRLLNIQSGRNGINRANESRHKGWRESDRSSGSVKDNRISLLFFLFVFWVHSNAQMSGRGLFCSASMFAVKNISPFFVFEHFQCHLHWLATKQSSRIHFSTDVESCNVDTPVADQSSTLQRPDNSKRHVMWTRLNWAACVCCAVGWWPIGSTEPGWSKLTYRRRLMVTLSASGRPD